MKKTKTSVSTKRTKTPPIPEEEPEKTPRKTPSTKKAEPLKTPKAPRKTSTKKVEIPVEEELPKTPKASRKTPQKKAKTLVEDPPPKNQEKEEPIKENNKIGIDNINVLFDSLLKISVKDILSSSENPDMTTPFNSILAIS